MFGHISKDVALNVRLNAEDIVALYWYFEGIPDRINELLEQGDYDEALACRMKKLIELVEDAHDDIS